MYQPGGVRRTPLLIAGSSNGPAQAGSRCGGIGHIMYFVYILKSLMDSGYYIGQTKNLDDRLKKHNSGQVRSTKSRLPFVLVRKEVFPTRSEARKRENYLKKLKGGNEFKKIIRN